MKKFKIIIEEHVSEGFEVEIENMEEAFNVAKNKDKLGMEEKC